MDSFAQQAWMARTLLFSATQNSDQATHVLRSCDAFERVGLVGLVAINTSMLAGFITLATASWWTYGSRAKQYREWLCERGMLMPPAIVWRLWILVIAAVFVAVLFNLKWEC